MTSRYIIGLTGASGAEYGLRLLWQLTHVEGETDVITSPNFFKVLAAEIDEKTDPEKDDEILRLIQRKYGAGGGAHQFNLVDYRDISARAASGSANYQAMAIVPCSMKTLAAVAHGLSQNLIERAADVSLKERRPLIVCPRESPLSLVHLRNMTALTEAGATVMPLMPGYYHKPEKLTDLYDFMADRIFSHMGITHRAIRPWRS